MATIKQFLLQLENDTALLDTWRKGKKNERKKLGTDNGLSNEDADLLTSSNLKQVADAVRAKNPGAEVLCVVMLD